MSMSKEEIALELVKLTLQQSLDSVTKPVDLYTDILKKVCMTHESSRSGKQVSRNSDVSFMGMQVQEPISLLDYVMD